ncbi:SDR family NAD(P)-dependent oxidoreductase [Brevibacterium sp. UCMA 11752]|uniref:SDR family NAD(P)-dependent oxidoreductase n=1 Tax=Brevibacterium sp. UCMA 11752 TaxID=2745946 RepID=UPI001F3C479A|nr:SDR family oxidoreductase [Brevibacterium sp. UCMA 11752]MCF2585796.1 SDR family oxidoreductase [Brevibacterium sp. UCMA 11752]
MFQLEEQTVLPSPPNRLEGTVSIVTGASGGLGSAIADRLIAEGSTVACLDVKEHTDPNGTYKRDHFFKCDITDAAAVESVVDDIAEQFGGIDILVNSAGILSGRESSLRTSSEKMHRYFDVNAVGPMHMVQSCYPQLKASRWRGRVINVASRTFFMGNPGQLAYIASKGALTGMTRVLAKEFGPDRVTVNAVMPAQVATPGTREHSGEKAFSSTMHKQAIEEFVAPSHFAGLVAFLSSPDGALITGQSMICDGGGLMR